VCDYENNDLQLETMSEDTVTDVLLCW